MEQINDELIPKQTIGSQIDAIEERKFSSLLQAQCLFRDAAKRLLDVNNWGKISGLSDFQLFDNHGEVLKRTAKVGDYIRIDILGPGPLAGGGFDWVRIETINAEDDGDCELISMQVRPSKNPVGKNEKIAHFLQSDATSTFLIRRNRITVYAEEHGRNETPNLKDAALLDKGRNFIVGLAAKAGLSYPQWKLLVKALLDGKV